MLLVSNGWITQVELFAARMRQPSLQGSIHGVFNGIYPIVVSQCFSYRKMAFIEIALIHDPPGYYSTTHL